MAIYEFAYINAAQVRTVVERSFKMSECPTTITIDENGVTYTATKQISIVARMKNNWTSYEPSDLPPLNSPVLGPQQ